MKRILVSGASGIVGYGILRSLRQAGESIFLVGSSIYTDSVAPAFCDEFELAPVTNAPEYLDWLTSTLRRHQIDMLIPGIEIDMYHWTIHVPKILETGAFPLLNTSELIQSCKDKWGFYQELLRSGSDFVIESSLERDFRILEASFGLPFLLKPRRGFGSKGIERIHSVEEFELHQSRIGDTLMVQPIVGSDDEEFTTSAFCDGRGGFFTCMTLRRKLSRDGFTDRAEVIIEDQEFKKAVEQLCLTFSPIGPTNFQFRRTKDGLKLLEINPRISSSTSIRAAFGYNESIMAVNYFIDRQEPEQKAFLPGKAIRYMDEAIFYENSIHF
jgi:carbamoyl-phosphate synthase large subunit